MTSVIFTINEPEISGKLLIIGMYLLGLKAQGKAKMKLPLDMVSKHALLYL
jgi:hypothetical protein